MSADSDCFVLRRFDKLFTRGILSHQDRLSELEEKLETLDSNYREVQPDGREINNGTIRDDVPDRKALVGEIRRELKEYCSYSLATYLLPILPNLHTYLSMQS